MSRSKFSTVDNHGNAIQVVNNINHDGAFGSAAEQGKLTYIEYGRKGYGTLDLKQTTALRDTLSEIIDAHLAAAEKLEAARIAALPKQRDTTEEIRALPLDTIFQFDDDHYNFHSYIRGPLDTYRWLGSEQEKSIPNGFGYHDTTGIRVIHPTNGK